MAKQMNYKKASAPAPKKGGSGKGIPKKASLFIYLATLVIAVACRTQQLFYNVNFNTGRYIDNSIGKNYTLFAIVIGMALIIVTLIVGKSGDKVIKSCILINPWRLRYDRLRKKVSSKAGYACLMMCLLIVIELIADVAQLISLNKEIRLGLPEDEAKNYSLLTGTTAVGVISGVLMFFVFLTFLSMAINIFKKEGISRANCAALCFFAAWKVVEIFRMFSGNNIIAVSSEKVYILLANMASVLFFLNTSRFFMGYEKKSTRFRMCVTGYLASILEAVSVIPRLIMLVTPQGYDDRINMALPEMTDFGLIFVTIAITSVFFSTYVYRVMPKMADTGRRRWTAAARPKDTSMKSLEVDDTEIDIKI